MEIGVKKLGPFLGPQFCSRAPDYIKMDQKCPQIEGFINAIGHVNNIPTMQFFTGISIDTQSKSRTLSCYF